MRAMKLVSGLGLVVVALAGCGGGGDQTRTVLGPAGKAELSPVPTAPGATAVPATPTATAGPAGKKAKSKHPKGVPAPPVASVTGSVTTAPPVVVPRTTPDPNLFQVKVTITAGAITLDHASLPAGRGMMFNITGKDVGAKGVATLSNGGAPIGISRVLPEGTHMETKSLVGNRLVITVKGSPRITAHRKVVPVG